MVLSREDDPGPGGDALGTADVLSALASPHRVEIIRLLDHRELDVGELASVLGISMANTSHHLARLRTAGLVASRREGTRVFNRLVTHDVAALVRAACDVARNQPAPRDP
jgi:DNA-binding transcriptional ArsR family regulator